MAHHVENKKNTPPPNFEFGIQRIRFQMCPHVPNSFSNLRCGFLFRLFLSPCKQMLIFIICYTARFIHKQKYILQSKSWTQQLMSASPVHNCQLDVKRTKQPRRQHCLPNMLRVKLPRSKHRNQRAHHSLSASALNSNNFPVTHTPNNFHDNRAWSSA